MKSRIKKCSFQSLYELTKGRYFLHYEQPSDGKIRFSVSGVKKRRIIISGTLTEDKMALVDSRESLANYLHLWKFTPNNPAKFQACLSLIQARKTNA